MATVTAPLDTTQQPVGGIIAGAQAAAAPVAAPIDHAQRINDIFQSNFGRKAADSGIAYWSSVANKDPSADLEGMIKQGAQTQDKAAMADISHGGIDTSSTWSSDLNTSDVASQKDVWDADKNKWTAAAPATPAPVAAAYTPATLGAPTKWDVAKDQTVAGQMEKYSDPNNPYVQQWGTQGAQEAAARGFTGNSSIRSTGILDSVMRNAAPIAGADAATHAKAAGYNTDESNQFQVANQNATNTASAFNAGQANQFASSRYAADKSATTQLGVTDKNNATALAQTGMSTDTQLAVAKLNTTTQAEVSRLHDANSALLASNGAAQGAYAAYVSAVTAIDQNDKMDYFAKSTALNTQAEMFNRAIAGLKAGTPGTSDLTGAQRTALAVPTPAPGTPEFGVAQVGGIDVGNMLHFDQ